MPGCKVGDLAEFLPGTPNAGRMLMLQRAFREGGENWFEGRALQPLKIIGWAGTTIGISPVGAIGKAADAELRPIRPPKPPRAEVIRTNSETSIYV